MNDEDVVLVAERLLDRICSELLECEPKPTVESDLFAAGLDSMSIMQLTLIVEEEFGVRLPDRLITRGTFTSARCIAKALVAARAGRI